MQREMFATPPIYINTHTAGRIALDCVCVCVCVCVRLRPYQSGHTHINTRTDGRER